MHENPSIQPILSVITALALVLSIGLLTSCKPGAEAHAPKMPPPSVSVAKVIAREVTQWDEFTGHIEAVESVRIQPRVGGYLRKVNFREGDEVKRGDVLFVIDQRPFRAELERVKAELARAQTHSELMRIQALRSKQLLDKHVVSDDEYDERIAADEQAKADIRADEAAVEIARLNLQYTEVRSPIDGRTSRALVTPGNLVAGGEMIPDATVLTTVVSLDPVYIYFEADEQTYLRYGAMARSGERPSSRQVANQVKVGLANNTDFPYMGHMDFVDNQVDPDTGTIRARAVLDNKARIFTPGLFARIQVIGSGKSSAILVDDKAILTDQDRKYVYVLGPNNTAQRRDIKLGRKAEGLRIVTQGLTATDQVIVYGIQKIFFPGMPVAPQMISMGDPPASHKADKPGSSSTAQSADS